MIGALLDLLGDSYVKGHFTQVETIARSLLSAVPDDRVSLQFLGLAYYRSGRVEQAIDVFAQLVERRRPSTSPRRLSWRDSRPTRRESPAAVCYEEATRPSADLARTWFDLGRVFDELGEPGKALAAFRSALAAQADFPAAMRALGETALRAGDLESAADGFGRLRTLHPEARTGYLGLARVYRRHRDFASARACLACARKLPDAAREGG